MSPGGNALEEALDRLYALPLREFTEERGAVARELKAAGEDDAAKRIKALRKPTRSAGAINRAVRERPDDARDLLAAADELRSAQERMLQGAGREAVEEATERERAATDRFMAAVEAQLDDEGGASRAMLERARGEVKDIWFDWLRENRPELVPRYEELYGGRAYLPSEEQKRLSALVRPPKLRRPEVPRTRWRSRGRERLAVSGDDRRSATGDAAQTTLF